MGPATGAGTGAGLGRDPDALLFPARGGGFRSLANWHRDIRWAALGMGRRIYDLRHTAATLWLGLGVDLKTVQTWLGHASAKLTADLYAHHMGPTPTPPRLRGWMRLWPGGVGGTGREA